MTKLLAGTWCLCLALAGSGMTMAQSSDTAKQASEPYDLRGLCLSDLESVEEKFIALANAVPADKLSSRPSLDSRSFAEVFLHVAGERYVILGLMGVTVPVQFEAMIPKKSTSDFEKLMPQDRARIIDELTKSWAFTKKTLAGMTNADFSKPLPKPGRQTRDGDLVILLLADQHEHLGQAVAYARENGIVPPWTNAGHGH